MPAKPTIADAAHAGDMELLRRLLAEGGDANQPSAAFGNQAPLQVAAAAGREEAVTVLLNHGVDVNQADLWGRTALHEAALKGHTKIVAALLAGGANPQVRDKKGDPPARYAAVRGQSAVLALLQARGAETKSFVRGSAAILLRQAAEAGNAAGVAQALASGADINTHFTSGTTALHLAAMGNHLAAMQELLAKRASVQAQDSRGNSPLHLAGNRDAVRLLLAGGADLHQANRTGCTPLHHAAAGGNLEVAQALLDAGAEINRRNTDNKTPLHLAAAGNRLELLQLLLARGAEVNASSAQGLTALHLAAEQGHDDVVAELLANGAVVAATDREGNTPLHKAVLHCRTEAAKRLITAQPASLGAENHAGQTPLHIAAEADDEDLFAWLRTGGRELSRDAQLDARDASGSTALHLAARADHVRVVQTLASLDADIDAQDGSGRTALHLAAAAGHVNLVETLVSLGADVDARDGSGRTALQLATNARQADREVNEGIEHTRGAHQLVSRSDSSARFSDIETLLSGGSRPRTRWDVRRQRSSTPAAVSCPNCGNQGNRPGARFCAHCGGILGSPAASRPGAPSASTRPREKSGSELLPPWLLPPSAHSAAKPGEADSARERSHDPQEFDDAPDVPEELPGERVECTVFAPPTAGVGDSILVQVFAHLRAQAAEAQALAREFDADAQRRAFKSLTAPIPRGCRLHFHLALPGLEVNDPIQELVWNGQPESVQFGVAIPAGLGHPHVVGTVTVSRDSIPIGHIKFKLTITAEAGAAPAPPGPAGDEARRYRQAFVSYAAVNRAEVLPRVQMLKTVGIRYFQDVLDLDPGERWEQALYRHIDECDLFLLFWSSSARQSEWVLKEVQYALQRKGNDEFAPPEIRPVIIEGPPFVPPPPELAHLHFNDRLLYFLQGERTA